MAQRHILARQCTRRLPEPSRCVGAVGLFTEEISEDGLLDGREELTSAVTQRPSPQPGETACNRDILLSLRLRGSIDDETFERRRTEIGSRRAQLEVKVAKRAPTVEAPL